MASKVAGLAGHPFSSLCVPSLKIYFGFFLESEHGPFNLGHASVHL